MINECVQGGIADTLTKHLRFLIVLLMTLVWSAGWAQEVTMDFTDNTSWNIPTSLTAKEQKFGTGNNEITLSNAYYYSTNYLMLKKGGTLTFTTFTFDVEKIVITGNSNASTNTKQNIYVGNVAVSSQTIGSTSTNTYLIKDGYQSAGNRYVLKVLDKNAQITKIQIYKKESSSSNKTATKVSFDSNSGQTFTFTEGEYSDGTFTAPTATETTGVEGTIVYSSDNVSAVKVNASTGALSFPGYGEATITATFTPTDAETYDVSTDSYKVKNEAKKSDNILTFSGELKSFDNVREYKNTLSEANVTLNGSDGKTYIFISNGGKNGSARFLLPTKTGKLQSPTFPSYINGYNVVITYGIGGTGYPSVTANGKKVTGTVKGDYNKGTGATLSLDVADGSAFTVTSGTNALAISKIEITPNAVDETETLTLDETATNNNIVAKAGVNVTLKRTMAKGVWNTICLPFDVTYDVAQAAFGNDVKIAELDKTSTGTILSFKNVDVIKAAKPYLIKPSTAYPAEGYVFKNVTIASDKIEPEEVATDDYSSFGFVGIYNKTDIYTGIDKTIFSGEFYAAVLGANNTVYKANPVKEPGKETKGFRAYFAIPNGVKAPELRVVIDGTATSIKNIDSEVVESNAPVYNLQGQRVDGNNLTPGIYVKAGKKFVVK